MIGNPDRFSYANEINDRTSAFQGRLVTDGYPDDSLGLFEERERERGSLDDWSCDYHNCKSQIVISECDLQAIRR